MGYEIDKVEKQGNISIEIGEVIITWIDGKFNKAVESKNKNKAYKINNKKIQSADLISEYNLVILKTENAIYFKYKNDTTNSYDVHWQDYFFDSLSYSLYRKDTRGIWYDTEGVQVKSNVILKDDVLISLNSKISKKNQIFKDQKLYTSPNSHLIQIGKIVLNNDLIPVTYYNEKITSIGKDYVIFNNEVTYQQVFVGLNKSAFIDEFKKQPILLNGNEIQSYKGMIKLGSYTFHIFKDEKREYYVDTNTCITLNIGGQPFTIESKSHILIGGYNLVRIKTNSTSYFYNLSKNKAFELSEFDKLKITKIEKSNIVINNVELYNAYSQKKSIVIKSNNFNRYELENKLIQIEKIKNIPGFENIFAFVTIKGKQQLFSIQTEKLILLENDAIVAVEGHSKNKLLNAITANGERIALDLRNGFKDLKAATSENKKITQTQNEPVNIGSKILQNVKIQTLGGSQERVINLNSKTLNVFQMPNDMMTYTDGDEKSVYAGTEIVSIDLKKIIEIGDQHFITANFRSYDDALHTVMLNYKSGKPFRIDGLGHKLELVTSFVEADKSKIYQIGQHNMIEVRTLKEDLKINSLLLSTKIMSSWIPFSDDYIPILKQMIKIDDSGDWEYNLFELHTLTNEKEFIAVEKTFPHRILAKDKGEKRIPLVVKSKEKVIKSPNEVSIIRKLLSSETKVLAYVQ